jgi:ParB-like chromosome segregation protein Spo0J
MDLSNEMRYILNYIHDLPLTEKVHAINTVKVLLHEISPFNSQPVDCILWVPNSTVHANDYNPNSVAPPEMELLKISIMNDGYTQPIVTMDNGDETREVIDGFHRNRCGKECQEIQDKVLGFLPVVTIKDERKEKGDRIAATIRHNSRAGNIRLNLCRILY